MGRKYFVGVLHRKAAGLITDNTNIYALKLLTNGLQRKCAAGSGKACPCYEIFLVIAEEIFEPELN